MQFTHIKEVCLYISDLEVAEAFYLQKLGLTLIHKAEGRHIFFRAGSTVLLCFIPEVTAQETTLPPHYAHGKQHIAFEVEDYEASVAELQALGITITHTQPWPGERESAYFEDPFGHVLELVPPGLWDPKAK